MIYVVPYFLLHFHSHFRGLAMFHVVFSLSLIDLCSFQSGMADKWT